MDMDVLMSRSTWMRESEPAAIKLKPLSSLNFEETFPRKFLKQWGIVHVRFFRKRTFSIRQYQRSNNPLTATSGRWTITIHSIDVVSALLRYRPMRR